MVSSGGTLKIFLFVCLFGLWGMVDIGFLVFVILAILELTMETTVILNSLRPPYLAFEAFFFFLSTLKYLEWL